MKLKRKVFSNDKMGWFENVSAKLNEDPEDSCILSVDKDHVHVYFHERSNYFFDKKDVLFPEAEQELDDEEVDVVNLVIEELMKTSTIRIRFASAEIKKQFMEQVMRHRNLDSGNSSESASS